MVRVKDTDIDSTDVISYPLTTIREVANEILTTVKNARTKHGSSWSIIQQYMTACAPTYKPLGVSPSLMWNDNVQTHMQDVLNPHEKRLTDSYDWLEKFANALLDMANEVEATDTQVANTYKTE
ncbi:hypothetical protein [Tengunoibacter tsumagoiensis]|uniref:Uncharacterized protein n=1 Tax=Tengunoibacter tsumagoiensis TaxID=2014871 RepID=A0A401ZVJ2_9CHLR|nr:hypothetical protein [Tengunoibacter tsumagoiensis]GCE10812.1 hypothetical protein KTT_06710 [Tengunoibacter tsumagoiensis]